MGANTYDTYIVEIEFIDSLWSVLRKSRSQPDIWNAEKVCRKIARQGWALKKDVEDLLNYLDSRIVLCQFDSRDLSEQMGVLWRWVYVDLTGKDSLSDWHEALKADEAALLLMLYERIGFALDPSILVDLLLPDVMKRKYKNILSNAQLQIINFKENRYRLQPIKLLSQNCNNKFTRRKTFVSFQGYKLIGEYLNKEIIGLKIYTPKPM
jgi:hypothetical protein